MSCLVRGLLTGTFTFQLASLVGLRDRTQRTCPVMAGLSPRFLSMARQCPLVLEVM